MGSSTEKVNLKGKNKFNISMNYEPDFFKDDIPDGYRIFIKISNTIIELDAYALPKFKEE